MEAAAASAVSPTVDIAVVGIQEVGDSKFSFYVFSSLTSSSWRQHNTAVIQSEKQQLEPEKGDEDWNVF